MKDLNYKGYNLTYTNTTIGYDISGSGKAKKSSQIYPTLNTIEDCKNFIDARNAGKSRATIEKEMRIAKYSK